MTREAVLAELSPEECWSLLATRLVGRLAVGGRDDCPLVLPVNYTVDGDAIVFRTDDGTKLRALGVGRASFQIDHFDPHLATGWSVLVRGDVYHATSWEIAALDLEPWVPGAKSTWIRLRAREVTGRRIDTTGFGGDPRGYL